MPPGKKKISIQEEEGPGGAPEWMVTFSDCMTLLLTFFVLLLSFSSFDKETLPALGESFAKALPSISRSKRKSEDSMHERQPSSQETKIEGTEVPSNTVEQTTNFMKEKKPLDFRNLKVFTIESKQFFWGQGYALSKDGREVLNSLANYLKHRTGRIVISENGPDGKTSLGLNRSIEVMDYLTKKHALDKARFNISCATTMRQPPQRRQLEITLLDRSIYE